MMKSLIFSFTLISSVYGEAADRQVELFSIDVSEVSIVNRGNIDLSFSIRPADGKWSVHRVKTGREILMKCRKCTTFEIKLNTNGVEVKYDLEARDRYSLECNNKKELWDVFATE